VFLGICTPDLDEVLLKAVVVSDDDEFCLPFEGDSVSRLRRVLWKSKMQQEQMKGTKKARNVEQKISPSTSFIFYNLSFVLIFFLSFLSRGECRGIPRIYISKREGEMAKRSKSPTKLKKLIKYFVVVCVAVELRYDENDENVDSCFQR